MTLLQLTHAFATLFMTGLIWFVQLVHYPLMNQVDRTRFVDYEKAHQRRTTFIVAPMMLIELITALLLIVWQPNTLTTLGIVLLGVTWLSTALLQVPAHRRLEHGFDTAAHRRLVYTNWLRTTAWSMRSMIALALLCG